MTTYESQEQLSEESDETRRLSLGERPARVLVCIALLLVVAYWTGLYLAQEQSLLGGASDFAVLYSIGKMVLNGQSSHIYDYAAQVMALRQLFGAGHTLMPPFTIGPYVLVLFAPLAMLRYPVAVLVWYAANAAMLIAIPFLLRRPLRISGKLIALAFLSLGFFYPISVALIQGQLTPLTLLLFTLVFLNLRKQRDFIAGSILALALYKPHFVLPLLLVLAFDRNWKAIRGFVCAVAMLFAASVVLVGWHSTVGFPKAILALSKLAPRISEPGAERMVNVRGLTQWLLASHLPHGLVMLIAGLTSLALVCLLIMLVRRNPISELGFALVVTITVLASYHCYTHDLGLVILALFLVAQYLTAQDMTNLRIALAIGAGCTLFAPSILPSPATVMVLLLFSAMLISEFVQWHTLQGASSGDPSLTPGPAEGNMS